jgi:hypothetical protein
MIESSLHPSDPVALPGPPFGRLLRNVAGYSLLTALMMVTPMLVFVPAALLHCAIRNGRRVAWLVGIVSVGLAVAYTAALPAPSLAADRLAWATVAALALAVVLPALALAPLVDRGEKFGRVLVWMLLLSCLGLGLVEVGSRAVLGLSPYAAQLVEAQQTSAAFVKAYKSQGMPAEMISLAERWLGYSTYVLPGVIVINLSLVFTLSLLMLGRLKAWRELAIRRRDGEAMGAYLFRNFTLPDWLLFAFVLGGLTPIATGLVQKVAANVLVVVAFLYILQGLAIFRFLLVAMGAGVAGTLLGWTLLAFLTITGVGPLLLGIAGLFDPFFDFRHFKKRKDDSHESHSD